ncbi:MAG TPA: UDP-N-acetylmuramate--L-alanine ligase [Tepidisphaeraceae bacterium]|jgi:UDP-N-acetylmuramate--alanine ligase
MPSNLPPTSRFTGRRVHFIGIGGSGMAGLARILLDVGAKVSGSEPSPNEQILELGRRGAQISADQTGSLLHPGVDLVVRTAAVKDNNPEYRAAVTLGLPIIKYAQLLGQVMAERLGIAVSGTHGKSTTTAMVAFALTQTGIDPSFVVGGTVAQLGHVGSRSGASNAFIAEACEYDRSFHNLHPKVAIITNIEADHLDCYKDLDDIIGSFRTFAQNLPPDGLLITSANDENTMKAVRGLSQRIEPCALISTEPGTPTYSLHPIAWSTRIQGLVNGCYAGDVSYQGRLLGQFRLSIPGRHNLINATMALAACHAAGGDAGQCIEALNEFRGVDRRMTPVGQYNGATVIDDYGHHPTEIRVTLSALREKYKPHRLIVIFQPHQHSRTRLLLKDFATAFRDADEVLLPPIYNARDTDADRQAVSSPLLAERINASGAFKAQAHPDFAAVVDELKKKAHPDDLIVTMGAGNVYEISQELIG